MVQGLYQSVINRNAYFVDSSGRFWLCQCYISDVRRRYDYLFLCASTPVAENGDTLGMAAIEFFP